MPRSLPKRLVLNQVSKRFGDVVALETMSLDVQPGELVALLGPSGCGKTTTLRLIAGFEFPDTGAVEIDGKDVSSLPPNKRSLGMVFQNYSLFPHLTVGENIGFGMRMAGAAKADIARAVERMLALIRLPEYADRRIGQLSGGQQQRVALARAIVTNPSVLLLDEPLGALDKNLREGMQFEIRRLQQSLGITSVMVTHDQEEAMTMSDRIVVMNRGKILQSGPPREVYERPRTRFVAEFLGTANVLTCNVLGTGDGTVRLGLGAVTEGSSSAEMDGNARVSFEAALPLALRGKQAGAFDVAVRPEKMALGAALPHHVQLQACVIEHVFRGSQHVYQLDVPGVAGKLYAYQQAASQLTKVFAAGQAVTLSFDPHDAVVLEPDDVMDQAGQRAPVAAMQGAALVHGEG
jgi:putative spermidine/putrescine transport system ATP-binding protein